MFSFWCVMEVHISIGPSHLDGLDQILTILEFDPLDIYIYKQKNVFFLVCNGSSGANWTQPSGWDEPHAVFYQSFDGSNGLILKEGSHLTNNTPLVSGKVNFNFFITVNISDQE